MVNIAYVIDTIETSKAGTEQQLLLLLEHLDRRRFCPYLLCLRPSTWLSEVKTPCETHVLKVGSLTSPGVIRGYAAFRQLHRRIGFDLVQTFFFDGTVAGTLFARLCGVEAIVASKRNIGHWQSHQHRLVLRALGRWTNRYLANSEAVRTSIAQAERFPESKIAVVHNCVSPEFLNRLRNVRREVARKDLGFAAEDTVVTSVANLRPVKKVDSMVEAAAAVVRQHPRVRFVVLGDGPERSKLESLIHARRLGDRFQLAGAVPDVWRYLVASDIAVHCSMAEGLSNSLIEYLAAGLPVVAASVGGNPEAIEHEVSGLLYPGERGSDLAGSICRLLEDRGLAHRIGARAHRVARERFGLTRCVAATESFYEDLVGGGRAT